MAVAFCHCFLAGSVRHSQLRLSGWWLQQVPRLMSFLEVTCLPEFATNVRKLTPCHIHLQAFSFCVREALDLRGNDLLLCGAAKNSLVGFVCECICLAFVVCGLHLLISEQ